MWLKSVFISFPLLIYPYVSDTHTLACAASMLTVNMVWCHILLCTSFRDQAVHTGWWWCSHWWCHISIIMWKTMQTYHISAKKQKKRKELWIKPALWTSGCWHLVLISDWFKDICDSSVNKCCTVGRWFDLEISESQRQTWNLIEVAGFRSSAAEGLQGETYSMTHGVDFSLCGIHPL